MKVLITGGAGFIGSHLADAYLARGDNVVIVDDLSSGSPKNIEQACQKGAQFYELSINSPELKKIFEDEKPELVNHHAAQKSVRDSVSNPIRDAQINIMGLLNLLESARAVGCKNVLFASSGGVVYGEQKEFPATEEHSTFPISPYGISKLCSEHYLRFYSENYSFHSICLRYANIYGPRQDPHGEAGVVSIFCDRLKQRKNICIYGSGNQTRDFVYVGDIVSVNLQVEKLLKGFQYFNVGCEREVSVNQLAKELCQTAGMNFKPDYGPARSGEQMRSVLSTRKIQQACGWKPMIGIEEGLQKTYQWFLNQQD